MRNEVTHSRGMALALSFVAVIWISPFSWLLTSAFDTAADGTLKWPETPGIGNFTEVFIGRAGHQLLNSLFISVAAATLTTAISIFAAYPLSRIRVPGRDIFLWGLVLLRMLPITGVLIPIFFAARNLGLLNLTGVVLVLTMLNLPFTLLLLKNFFDTVPLELEEAAYVEGASFMQIMTKIVIPISKAGIAVIWFFSFTGAWNEFLLPLIFVRTDAGFPMSVGLYASFGLRGIDYGFLTAYATVYATPAVIVYFLIRKNLNTGFAGVGVKG